MPSRDGDMDALARPLAAARLGLYSLIHRNKSPKPVSGPRCGLSGRGKKHKKGGSDGTTRP
jgi:hypothetical protein